MFRAELKNYMKHYHKILNAVRENRSEITVGRYGQKKKLLLPEWTKKLEGYVEEILASEPNPIFQKVIRENLIEGKTDSKIFSELPISESGYYRYKRIFMERLYELYISEGMVTREEILKESISE